MLCLIVIYPMVFILVLLLEYEKAMNYGLLSVHGLILLLFCTVQIVAFMTETILPEIII